MTLTIPTKPSIRFEDPGIKRREIELWLDGKHKEVDDQHSTPVETRVKSLAYQLFLDILSGDDDIYAQDTNEFFYHVVEDAIRDCLRYEAYDHESIQLMLETLPRVWDFLANPRAKEEPKTDPVPKHRPTRP